MTDLTTQYLGLELRSPIVASAGPLQQKVDGIRQLAEAGAGAIVMYSLFEEQLRQEQARMDELEELYADSFSESMTWFPTVPSNDSGTTVKYLSLLEQGASAIDVPLIGSINGATNGGWVRYARQMQDAGAAAIELNIYLVPGQFDITGADVEERHLEILAAVKDEVTIPVSVKLSPFFSAFGDFAHRLDRAGADGLVLFNRFLQPDVDVERLQVTTETELSTPADAKVPRMWIASLAGKLKASLAATSGVETSEDIVKYLLAGADVVMTTSSLVRHGPAYIDVLTAGLKNWLERKELTLAAARGALAVPAGVDSGSYQRAGYVAALEKAKSTYAPM